VNPIGFWSRGRGMVSCPPSEDRIGLGGEKLGFARVGSFDEG
jgi:hypothetical protein